MKLTTLKKTFLLAFTAAALVVNAAVETGKPAPELTVKNWVKGKPVKITEFKGKKPVVLFFWSVNQQCIAELKTVMALAARYASKAEFVGIVADNVDTFSKFQGTKQFTFPLAVDNDLSTINLYMRNFDQVPMIAIINEKGLLVWRGNTRAAIMVLPQVIEGKYNLKEYLRKEKVTGQITEALKIKDFPAVIKLLDKELELNPASLELLNFKCSLLTSKQINKPNEAIAAVEKSINAIPGTPSLYELKLKLLRKLNKNADILTCYNQIAKVFAKQPNILLSFVAKEMNAPINNSSPEAIYILGKAAYESNSFKNDTEKGKVFLTYARILYYCGRVDLALTVAKQALPLLKKTKQFDNALTTVKYYQKILKLSKNITLTSKKK